MLLLKNKLIQREKEIKTFVFEYSYVMISMLLLLMMSMMNWLNHHQYRIVSMMHQNLI